jgi:Ca2+-transporting ATPase
MSQPVRPAAPADRVLPDPGLSTLDGVAWHADSAEVVLTRLGTTRTGLDPAQRAVRREQFGANEVRTRKPKRWLPELAESLAEPLQLLLIAVAVLSGIFGELSDALVIAAVIAVVAFLETATEMRAAHAIDALRAMTAPTARLLTPAGITQIPAAALVPGDVVAVEAGDVVPADARVLTAGGLRLDESTLTGEAQPVGKSAQPVAVTADLADRTSMIYAGTAVVAGEGTAIIIATGPRSELGAIGKLVADAKEPPTPLQAALSQLARAILIAAIAASILVPVVGVLAGQPVRDMVLAGLTVAFATIPEELPILVVVLLAVGGRQLARRGALLRRLRAGETLGSITVVVTDKTGTLTENRLTLAGTSAAAEHLLAVAVAAQPSAGAGREPMEEQLAAAAQAASVPAPGAEIAAYPFDPHRKLVSRLRHTGDGQLTLAVAGAPEQILARCLFPDGQDQGIAGQVQDLAGRGMRVIAFASRELSSVPQDRDEAETGLTFAGLAWFTDPLRDGVRDAVAALTQAGVATIVVTGDHPATADAVATQAGLRSQYTVDRGQDLMTWPDEQVQALLVHGTVVARATPATKHHIVTLLQQRGETVAVTGDGANDAPALAAADVGIALGRHGADLARAAADLVLTDDAYPTVVAAVRTGRNISAQLRRAVAFYLGAKLALVIVLLIALAAGLPIPFTPVQIVLLEIFMDLGASVAFVAEPTAPQAMHQPPRPSGTRFLDRPELSALAVVAATLSLATLPGYLLLAHTSTPVARAAATLGWLAGHALIAWTLRTQPGLSWRINPAFPAWAAIATTAGLVFAFTPAGQLIHLAPLTTAGIAITATSIALAVTTAWALGRILRLPQRL